jgi:sialic acid synthase SpsE
MKIGSFDTGQRVLVVAEIGNNHEGSVGVARRLVEEAAACGADAVKFQTFKTEAFVRRSDTRRFDQLKRFEFSARDFADLAEAARALKLLFLSTPLDLGSVDALDPIVDAFKIASGDNDFYPLLARVASAGKPLILSSGASDLDQIQRSVSFLQASTKAGRSRADIAVLHCVSSYPAPLEEANLRSIPFLMQKLSLTIGYSDHTLSPDAALLAVGLGARIVEKHFTLDKNFSDFRDHRISADPEDLRALVRRIREAEALLGAFDKRVQTCEEALVPLIRRAIVAATALPEGHRIAAADLTWLRPAGKLRPGDEAQLIGKRLRRPVVAGEALSASDAS